ncbi:MAG TPA: tetratricopeptide repeat protein [Capsulimonadaceae bacterium]|jgi:tetratricopeptide (TPR) repeat protein
MKISKLTALLTALLVVAPAAFGGPLDEGNTAYKAKDYAAAVTAYTSALGKVTGDEQAKAYYKLGLAYEKLDNYAKAVECFEVAQRIDGTLGFAKNKAGFRRKLARDSQYAQGTATPPASTGSGAVSTGDSGNVAQILATTNVYVDSSFSGKVDETALQAVAAENPRTSVKIALIDHLPSWYQKLARSKRYSSDSAITHFTEGIHKHLNLGRNGVIVVSTSGYGAGVALKSADLSDEAETRIARNYVAKLQAGDYAVIAPMAHEFVSEINGAHRMQQNIIWLVALIIVLVIAVIIVKGKRRKAAQLNAMRGPVNALRSDVEASIEYLDGYIPALAKNNADTDQVKAYRQASAARFEQATKIIDRATETSDLVRAQRLLEKAKEDSVNAKRYLDRATGGTGNIPGDAAVSAASLPADVEDLANIPENERGVSFFSSRPAPIDKLVPVTINVGGVDRQVLATPAEAAEIRRGQLPAVRSFEVGGRQVPWYMYDAYDPYRDYYSYQQNGWSSAVNGAIAGFIGAQLLDSLFSRPAYGGSWMSPYGYAPGWDNWSHWGAYDRGFLDGERIQAHDYAFNDGYSRPPVDSSSAGGAGFFGSGYDQSDYGSSGSAGGAGFFGGSDSDGGGGDNS